MKRSIMLHQVNEATNTFKAYQVIMEERADGWAVSAYNGRIGSTLKEQPKGTGLDLDKANAIFNKTVEAKMKGGYLPQDGAAVEMASAAGISGREVMTDMVPMRPTAFDIEDIATLDPREWMVQEKHDGESRPVRVTADGVVGTNHGGQIVQMRKDVADQVMRLQQIFGDLRFDSEDLGNKGLMIFDVVSGITLTPDSKFFERNLVMAEIATAAKRENLDLIRVDPAVLMTDFLAENGIDKLRESLAEGFVMKRADSRYAPGRSNNPNTASALKAKFTEDATFRVAAGRNADKRSVGIESWDAQAAEWVLRGNVTIPQNVEMPKIGDLIDVTYLYITGPNGAPIQPVFKRPRPDAQPEDCDGSKLKMKRTAPETDEDPNPEPGM